MPKILLVDDDELLTTMYKTRFEAENYTVLIADNGETALECLRKEHPDIVLLDLMLPKGGGMSILEEKNKDESIKNIPVIVLSNLTDDSLKQQVQNLGAKEFLMKAQYTPTQIFETMKKYVSASAAPLPVDQNQHSS